MLNTEPNATTTHFKVLDLNHLRNNGYPQFTTQRADFFSLCYHSADIRSKLI